MEEGAGFEPARALTPYRISRAALSTTQTSLHMATSARFERATSSSAGKRSNPLSYEAIINEE
jgi:hypothetical protein